MRCLLLPSTFATCGGPQTGTRDAPAFSRRSPLMPGVPALAGWFSQWRPTTCFLSARTPCSGSPAAFVVRAADASCFAANCLLLLGSLLALDLCPSHPISSTQQLLAARFGIGVVQARIMTPLLPMRLRPVVPLGLSQPRASERVPQRATGVRMAVTCAAVRGLASEHV